MTVSAAFVRLVTFIVAAFVAIVIVAALVVLVAPQLVQSLLGL
jgi:hypothetical protein